MWMPPPLQDMEDGLYGSYHFNFISPISRQRLEDLAMSTIRANAVQQVQTFLNGRIAL